MGTNWTIDGVKVALAAKNARIAWALLAHERSYQHDYVVTRKAA